MYQVIDIQTSVPAIDIAIICKLSIASLGHGLGANEENCLIQSLWKSRLPAEKYQHTFGGGKNSLDALGRIRETI